MQLKDLTPIQRTRRQYNVCKTIEKRLTTLSDTGDNTKYFDVQVQLIEELNALLSRNEMTWSALTKLQIMHILSMCSSHRPTALHTVLNLVARQYDRMK